MIPTISKGTVVGSIFYRYGDVIMGAIASQVTSLTIVYMSCLSRRRSKKTSKLCVTGLCAGNSPGTGEFPAQMASYAEIFSIWWRHHVLQDWEQSQWSNPQEQGIIGYYLTLIMLNCCKNYKIYILVLNSTLHIGLAQVDRINSGTTIHVMCPTQAIPCLLIQRRL